MINMLTICKKELMLQTGFTDAVAGRVIREAKKEMVAKGFNFYANKRLGRVPVAVVNQIIALQLQGSEFIGNVSQAR